MAPYAPVTGMMGQMHEALLNGKPMNMIALLRQGKAWAVNGVVADGHAMKPMLNLERGKHQEGGMMSVLRVSA